MFRRPYVGGWIAPIGESCIRRCRADEVLAKMTVEAAETEVSRTRSSCFRVPPRCPPAGGCIVSYGKLQERAGHVPPVLIIVSSEPTRSEMNDARTRAAKASPKALLRQSRSRFCRLRVAPPRRVSLRARILACHQRVPMGEDAARLCRPRYRAADPSSAGPRYAGRPGETPLGEPGGAHARGL